MSKLHQPLCIQMLYMLYIAVDRNALMLYACALLYSGLTPWVLVVVWHFGIMLTQAGRQVN